MFFDMKNKNNGKKLLILATLTFLGIGLDQRLKVVKYDLESKKIDSPLRLLFISDLHGCDYGEKQIRLVERIQTINPDIVLLGGDIVDDEMPEEKSWELVEFVGKNYKTFYVTGNHELWTDDVDRIKLQMKNSGIIVLHGDKFEFKKEGTRLDIFGIDDPDIGDRYWLSQLKNVKSKIDEEVFSLLLSHRPEKYKDYLNFDLSLSGHAHGGQWIIPFLINGLFAPNQGFFPKYAGGKYAFDNHTLIVSRGLARESTRVPRFYNRPELVVIDLKPQG